VGEKSPARFRIESCNPLGFFSLLKISRAYFPHGTFGVVVQPSSCHYFFVAEPPSKRLGAEAIPYPSVLYVIFSAVTVPLNFQFVFSDPAVLALGSVSPPNTGPYRDSTSKSNPLVKVPRAVFDVLGPLAFGCIHLFPSRLTSRSRSPSTNKTRLHCQVRHACLFSTEVAPGQTIGA